MRLTDNQVYVLCRAYCGWSVFGDVVWEERNVFIGRSNTVDSLIRAKLLVRKDYKATPAGVTALAQRLEATHADELPMKARRFALSRAPT